MGLLCMDLSFESKVHWPKTLGSRVEKIAENFVCFWDEISVQSPAFPSPKSRPRVQRFQNAGKRYLVASYLSVRDRLSQNINTGILLSVMVFTK